MAAVKPYLLHHEKIFNYSAARTKACQLLQILNGSLLLLNLNFLLTIE
jgi:hypothetical protein